MLYITCFLDVIKLTLSEKNNIDNKMVKNAGVAVSEISYIKVINMHLKYIMIY